MKLTSLFALTSLLAIVCSCGGGAGAADAVGAYQLDTSGTKQMMEKELEGQPEMAKEMARNMMASLSGSLELKDDDTFVVAVDMGVGEMSAKGTWSLDGETLSMTTTEEDGKKVEDGETQTATYKDGTITMSSDEENAPPMIFKRK